MTAATIDKAYQDVGTLTGLFNIPYTEKKVSVMKQIFRLSDEESVKNSVKILEDLFKIQESLPKNGDNYDVKTLKEQFAWNNKNLVNLNSFHDTFLEMFSNQEGFMVVDDEDMKEVLKNLTKAKGLMQYISAYLQIKIELYEDMQTPEKEYTYNELIAAFQA